jgi:hypothetical protein
VLQADGFFSEEGGVRALEVRHGRMVSDTRAASCFRTDDAGTIRALQTGYGNLDVIASYPGASLP